MDVLVDFMSWLNANSGAVDILLKGIGLLATPASVILNALFRSARRFSPATGLAPGYYKNFLLPVLSAKDGPKELLLWMSGAGDSLMRDRAYFEDSKRRLPEYNNVRVGDGQHSRTILITLDDDRTRIGLDFPRSLTGDLPSLIKETGWLRRIGGDDAVQRRELRNFWETLTKLIRNGEYRTRIRAFDGDARSAKETALSVEEWSELLDRVVPAPNFALRVLGY